MDQLDDEFLKKALQLVVDGTDPEIVRNVMQIDLDNMEARHSQSRAWFDSLSVLAPAFGLLGTLIGLVGMLKNLGGNPRCDWTRYGRRSDHYAVWVVYF